MARERGTAVLEASIGIGLVMLLLGLGIALVDHTEQSDVAQDVADKALFETTVRPIALRVAPDGSVAVGPNHAALAGFVSDVALTAETELRARLAALGNPNNPYFVEVRYGTLKHNRESGAFTGQIELPAGGHVTRGSLTLDAETEGGTSLVTRFQRLGTQDVSDGRTMMALMTGAYGRVAPGGEQFLEDSVVVGIRVVAALPSHFGAERMARGIKAVVLRGGVGDDE